MSALRSVSYVWMTAFASLLSIKCTYYQYFSDKGGGGRVRGKVGGVPRLRELGYGDELGAARAL